VSLQETAAKSVGTEKPPVAENRNVSDRQMGTHRRVVIERVQPEINCGAFAIKRVVGDTVVVEADVFADGRDRIACRILYWSESWSEARPEPRSSPMKLTREDRWRGEFRVSEIGSYRYTIEAWIDRFQTWRSDLMERIAAGQDVRVDLLPNSPLARTPRRCGHGSAAFANRVRKSPDRRSRSKKTCSASSSAIPIRNW
jgi:starch synthase (maltosyl-transferring)